MKSFKLLSHKSSALFFLCLLPLFSSPTFAIRGHVYLSGTAGASRLTLGDTRPEINYYDGFLSDVYRTHSKNSTIAAFGFQGGYEFAPASRYKPAVSLGLGAYTGAKNYSYHGDLIETPLGDPSITPYNYKFFTQATRLMAEAQMTWRIDNVTPFINIGLGEAWIRTSRYSDIPSENIDYPPLPPFQGRNNANFAVQAGLGLGYEFNISKTHPLKFKHERISLGYRYVNLGNASFGIRGSAYPYKLNLGNLSSNELYLTYTHLF